MINLTKSPDVLQGNISMLKKLVLNDAKIYKKHIDSFKEGLENAIKIGAYLTTIKNQLAHGKFLPTLKKEGIEFTSRTAQRYMMLALHQKRILANAEVAANYSINKALAFLEQEKLSIAAPKSTQTDKPKKSCTITINLKKITLKLQINENDITDLKKYLHENALDAIEDIRAALDNITE